MDRGSRHCTGGRDQDHPQRKEMQKGKMVVRGGLTNSCEKRRSEKQRRKGKICPFECRVYQRIAKRDKKAILSDQCKEIEENNRMGKTGDLIRKIRDTKGTFHAKMGSIKTETVWTQQKQKMLRRELYKEYAYTNYTRIHQRTIQKRSS